MSLTRPAQRNQCDTIKPILLYAYRTIITRPCEGLKVRVRDSCREAWSTLRACPYIDMHAIVSIQANICIATSRPAHLFFQQNLYMPHLPKKTKNINSLQLLQHLYRVLHYIRRLQIISSLQFTYCKKHIRQNAKIHWLVRMVHFS